MSKRIAALIISYAVLGLGFSAVASAGETNPYGGTAVTPPAANEVIFTVTNGKNIKTYSMNSLKKLKPTTIRIYEPFVKKQQSFDVIPLAAFAKISGINSKAVLKTIALNDYVYSNSLSNFISAKAHIAIARNGKPIPYDQGGPIRIVFPKDSRWAQYLDPWNWSLATIMVK